ncbi:MAG: two-component system, OmpR family, response regulator [Thermoleophilaceae bacterium]|jgi:two-component system OmpR family response regulator|nr:two-component system, OmpR family, response regulator [Thermoleophilaceae bacterium]
MRILIVEDDARMADAIRRGLKAEGMAVDVAGAGEDALWLAEATAYSAIVLDYMLPGIDGVETCRRLRAEQVWTPILMLTARDAVRDRVAGLNSGADDYLVKPFSFDELLARVRALARRQVGPRPTVLSVGDLRLETTTHRLWRGSQEIPLSNREITILEAFMRRPGQILSRFDLLELVWEGDFDHRSNVVDVAVRRLREKIDRPFGVESIETVRGAGYRLCDSADW